MIGTEVLNDKKDNLLGCHKITGYPSIPRRDCCLDFISWETEHLKQQWFNILLYTCINIKILDTLLIYTFLHLCNVSYMCVQFSRSVMSDSLRPHELQHARPPCPSPTPGVHPDSIHRVRDAIQPSHPQSSTFPPAPNPSQHQSLFQWVNSSHEVAKVLEFQL